MNLFVALCTIATLYFIRASAFEENDHDVEDRDLDMDMELSPRDLEDYDGEDLDVELRQDSDGRRKPRKHPYCVRTFHSGWGGQCLTPADLLYQNCDFIWNATETRKLCYFPDQYCCVDCNAQKQTKNCGNIEGLTQARRECCSGELAFKNMNSGCNCCGKCKPSRKYCTKKGGFCVTRDDPVCSFDYCKNNGGKLKYKRCEGEHCKCCIGSTNPDNCG